MGFATGYLDDPSKVGAGERHGSNLIILSFDNFEDNLKVGRFAKLEAGRIDNMDGSVSPVIAGLVLRNAAAPVEDGILIDTALYSHVDLLHMGLGTVRVKAGETPAPFGLVYASNDGDANDGMATADSSDVATGARFIQEVQDGVWLISLSGQPSVAVTNLQSYIPPSYTVATVPDATENEGLVIFVSDGAAGEETLARSDGTNWIALDGSGAVISGA